MSSSEIKIKITEEFEEKRKQASDLTSRVAEAGGFTGQHGKTRKANIDASLAAIDEILKKNELNLNDLADLDKFFSELYKSLGKAAANTTSMSEEMNKLIQRQAEALTNLKEVNTLKDELLSKGKLDKDGMGFTSQKGANDVIRGLNVHRLNKDGSVSKRQEVNFENIRANMAQGVKYVDDAGNDLQDNPVFQNLVQSLESLNREWDNVQSKLKETTEALDRLTNAIDELSRKEDSGETVSQLVGDVAKGSVQSSQVISSVRSNAIQQKTVKDTNKTPIVKNNDNREFKKVFKEFSIYTMMQRTLTKAVHSAVRTIRDLDKYLTEQAMVTGKTRKEVFGLTKSYQNLAIQYNTTTKEVAEVNTEFMRQGKTIADSLKLTQAAIASARVAGVSGAESVNYLTTALNGFQLSAKEAMTVSDKFAAIAAASATDYEEIATALSKVASQAHLAGMSIDYTTALLATGVEVTKEAPETIGTALKTVIARMRELTDYGATLEDGMDLNNVETQLRYVGIELRNTSGELRSSEEVLDDLGRKWDTLSVNQQAAVAKALAGTRQQSRLIAMMNDYERVLELQTISQRSQGATLAQQAALMEGLEASLNEISIQWEKIVSNLVNNDLVVQIADIIGWILEKIADVTENGAGQVLAWITLIGTAIAVWKHFHQDKAAKEEQSLTNQMALEDKHQKIILMQNAQVELAETIREQKKRVEIAKTKKLRTEAYIQDLNQQRSLLIVRGESTAAIDQQLAQADKLLLADMEAVSTEESKLDTLEKQYALDNQKLNAAKAELTLLAKSLLQHSLKATIQILYNKLKNGEITKETIILALKNLQWLKILAIVAAVAATIAVVTVLFNWWKKVTMSVEKATEITKELANENHKYMESNDKLDTIISKYEQLDKKLIKTKEDLEAINDLMAEASELIDDETLEDLGYSREIWDAAGNSTKLEIINKVKEDNDQKIKDNFKKIDETIKKVSKKQKKKDAYWAKDSNQVAARSGFDYALTKSFEKADINAEDQADIQSVVSQITDSLDGRQIYDWGILRGEYGVTDTLIKELNKTIKTEDGNMTQITKVITDSSYSLADRMKAYQEMMQVSNAELRNALQSTIGVSFESLINKFGVDAQGNRKTNEEIVKIMEELDKLGIGVQELNDLYGGYNKTKSSAELSEVWKTEEAYTEYIDKVLQQAAETGDVIQALSDVFKEEANGVLDTKEKVDKGIADILVAVGNGIVETNDQISQKITQFQSKMDNVYETASKWSEMDPTQKAQFMQSHADLFAISGFEDAMENQDFDKMEEAMKQAWGPGSEGYQAMVKAALDGYNSAVAIHGKDSVEAQIAKMLLDDARDIEKLFSASLETRKAQQDKQLSMYKKTLEKERDALTKSLNQRKEAYQTYFDAINQQQEDEDYEEKFQTLAANITKLNGSNAATEAKRAELEKQMIELEKERLETLRQRGQEQVISNIDNEVKLISDKFDKLLSSNDALLTTMQNTSSSELFSKLMTTQLTSEENSLLDMQTWLEDMKTSFGSMMPELSDLKIEQGSTQNSLILNVNGKTYNLNTADEDSLFTSIQEALIKLGITGLKG